MKEFKIFLRKFFSKPEYIFIVPALIFGTLSAVLVPQLIVNDENMHFIRSYELSELEFGHKCTIPADIKERGFYAMYTGDSPDYTFSNSKVDTAKQIETDCGTATSYNPILHLPQVAGVLVAKAVWPTAGAMILIGRMFNVLLYCAALFFIIRKARIGKWLLVVVGLMPMMVHMAGSLSGDVVNNIVLIGFIVYVFNLYTQRSSMTKRQLLALLMLSGLLAVTKLPNLALLLMLLFLPSRVIPSITIRKLKIPKHFTRILLAGLAAVASLAVVFVWSRLYDGQVVSSANISNPITEEPYKIIGVLFNTFINPNITLGGVSFSDWLFRGALGSFASFGYHLPFTIVALLTGLIFAIGFRSDKEESTLVKDSIKPLVATTVTALVIIIVAVTYGLYTAWAIQPSQLGEGADYALGLQGRYFTPLILLALPLMILLRRYVSINFKEGATTGVTVFVVMCIVLAFYIAQTVSYVAALSL